MIMDVIYVEQQIYRSLCKSNTIPKWAHIDHHLAQAYYASLINVDLVDRMK